MLFRLFMRRNTLRYCALRIASYRVVKNELKSHSYSFVASSNALINQRCGLDFGNAYNHSSITLSDVAEKPY